MTEDWTVSVLIKSSDFFYDYVKSWRLKNVITSIKNWISKKSFNKSHKPAIYTAFPHIISYDLKSN